MLSLLKNDLNVLTKQYKMYVILLVFFLCAGSVSTTDEFFSTFPLVVCSWFTASLIGWDERCYAEGTLDPNAVSRRTYVQGKYLFLFIMLALSLIITVSGLVSRYPVGSPDFCNVLLTMLAAAFLVPSIMLPVIFKNSAKKSVLKYLLILIVAVAVCYYFSAAFEHRYIARIGLVPVIIAGIVFLALYVFSCMLSIKYYEKREL